MILTINFTSVITSLNLAISSKSDNIWTVTNLKINFQLRHPHWKQQQQQEGIESCDLVIASRCGCFYGRDWLTKIDDWFNYTILVDELQQKNDF